jgi:hypothetical protein
MLAEQVVAVDREQDKRLANSFTQAVGVIAHFSIDTGRVPLLFGKIKASGVSWNHPMAGIVEQQPRQ